MSIQFSSFAGLRLLIVDDHLDTMNLLAFMFEMEGAEVTTAASASEALKALSCIKPDVLISDIKLPDEDGFWLLRKIREQGLEQNIKIPAIALTGFARAQDRIDAYLAGFQMYLSKPIDLDDLAVAVASVAGNRQL